jgi:hypothetical protein
LLPTSKYRIAAALSCAAALLSGCATPCLTTVEPGRYTLSKGVPVPVSPTAHLTLVRVDDSRCPEGVQCIWAGKISYQLVIESCGKTQQLEIERRQHSVAIAGTTMSISVAPEDEPPPRGPRLSSPVRSVRVVISAT